MDSRLNEPWDQPEGPGAVPDPFMMAALNGAMNMPGGFPIDPPDYYEEEVFELPGDESLPVPELDGDSMTTPQVKFDTQANFAATSGSKSKYKPRIPPKPTSLGPKILKKPPKDVIIAVFGLTGTGKSTFISRLTGKAVKIGHGLNSCTSEIEEFHCKIGAINVTLVDTPGFDDTTLSDSDVLALIASYMMDHYENGSRLTGVIYLHPITEQRMRGSSMKNLRLLRQLCGRKALSNVVLATNKWDDIADKDLGERREQQLLSEDSFWGELKQLGAIVRRHDGSHISALGLVDEFVEKSPTTLKIQREMGLQKKALGDTAAGRSVTEQIEELSNKHKEEMAEVKKEIKQAIVDNDLKWRDELKRQETKVLEEMKQLEEQKKVLRTPVNRRAWYAFSWKCKNCGAKLRKSEEGNRRDPKGQCPQCFTEQIFVD